MKRSGLLAHGALLAATVGSAMSFIDGTAVNVALPIMQKDLGASAAEVQWVVEGYSLFLSALILIGGSLGDLYGRKRIFSLGIGLFAAASIGCAFAPNAVFLIVARCVQGVGGALSLPGSLALITAAYTGEARGRAIGTWSGFASITGALGPLLGGGLVQYASWRWVFAINVPLALLVLAVLAYGVDESRDAQATPGIDVAGAILATLGLGGLIFGLIHLQGGLPDALGLASVVAGCALLAVFVYVEAHEPHPMIDLAVFRSRTFAAGNIYTFLLYAGLGGGFFFLPFDMINVQGYTPSAAGAANLPFILIMFTLSRFSGGLVTRIGARIPLVLGALLAASAFVIFSFAGVGKSYWVSFFPGAVLLGLGGASFVAPLTTTVMDAVSTARAGVASGINNAVARTAGLVAIAALGIALAGGFESSVELHLGQMHGVSAATVAIVKANAGTIVTGVVPAQITDPAARDAVRAAVKQTFAAQFQLVMLVTAVLALIAAGIGFDGSFRRVPASR